MVRPGDVLLVGGFGMTGNPVHLLDALAASGTGDLTYVGNNVGANRGSAAGNCCAMAN